MDEKSHLEIKKNKDSYEVIASYGKRRGSKGSNTVYHNIITKDPKMIAQVLLDLEMVDNFPIKQAIDEYLKRRDKKDWLGF